MYGSSGKIETTVSRPHSSANLFISSTDRYTDVIQRVIFPTTASDWALPTSKYALLGYFERLAVTQIQMQWNVPTIIAGKNDVINVVVYPPGGGSVYLVYTITPGFYSGDELAAEVQQGLRAATGYLGPMTLTVTYRADNSFRIIVAAGYSIELTSATLLPTEIDANQKLLITMGFIGGTVSGDAIQGSSAQMLYTRWIDIVSDEMGKYQKVKDTNSFPSKTTTNVIARIYATPPNVLINNLQPGQLFSTPWIMTIDYNTPKYINYIPEQGGLANLNFQLIDEYGEPLFWSSEYPTEYQLTVLASES
jgi:hypothetical protein